MEHYRRCAKLILCLIIWCVCAESCDGSDVCDRGSRVFESAEAGEVICASMGTWFVKRCSSWIFIGECDVSNVWG